MDQKQSKKIQVARRFEDEKDQTNGNDTENFRYNDNVASTSNGLNPRVFPDYSHNLENSTQTVRRVLHDVTNNEDSLNSLNSINSEYGSQAISEENADEFQASEEEVNCNVVINRISKEMQDEIMEQLLRVGCVCRECRPYFRSDKKKGYVFINFANPNDAECAVLLFSNYFTMKRSRLNVTHAMQKTQLVLQNIPCHLTEDAVENIVKESIPNLDRVVIDCRATGCKTKSNEVGCTHICNNGWAYLYFRTHHEALAAMISYSNKPLDIMGSQALISWALYEIDFKRKTSQFLIVENSAMHMKALLNRIFKLVPCASLKFAEYKDDNTVELMFSTCDAADKVRGILQHIKIENNARMHISCHYENAVLFYNDFSENLRFMCIANNWCLPIFIYGNYDESLNRQYCAIVLRNDVLQKYCFIICSIDIHYAIDLQSRACEVAVGLLHTFKGFPSRNYFFDVTSMIRAKPMGYIESHGTKITISSVCDFELIVRQDIAVLSWVIKKLITFSETQLIELYKQSFNEIRRNKSLMPSLLSGWYFAFASILPYFTGKRPLACGLNSSEIILVLYNVATKKNVSTQLHESVIQHTFRKITKKKDITFFDIPLQDLTENTEILSIERPCNCLIYGSSAYYENMATFARPIDIKVFSYKDYIRGESINNFHYLEDGHEIQNPQSLSTNNNTDNDNIDDRDLLMLDVNNNIESPEIDLDPEIPAERDYIDFGDYHLNHSAENAATCQIIDPAQQSQEQQPQQQIFLLQQLPTSYCQYVQLPVDYQPLQQTQQAPLPEQQNQLDQPNVHYCTCTPTTQQHSIVYNVNNSEVLLPYQHIQQPLQQPFEQYIQEEQVSSNFQPPAPRYELTQWLPASMSAQSPVMITAPYILQYNPPANITYVYLNGPVPEIQYDATPPPNDQ